VVNPQQQGTAPILATPENCPLMQSFLNAAREMFAGDSWDTIEPLLRRAWRGIREPTQWEEVHAWMRAAWAAPHEPAANDGADAGTPGQPQGNALPPP
jgi:hypothetical protein